MKKIGITQRVDFIEAYTEYRDGLDQRWADLALNLGFLPVSLPNTSPDLAKNYIQDFGLDAVIFSGGNTLAQFDPKAKDANPKRDEFEQALLKAALEKEIPVLGVCRGMQMINQALGGTLVAVEGHVATRHTLKAEEASLLPNTVNSYHGCGIEASGLAADLIAIAFDDAGRVEAYKHKTKKLLGLMWHPEREMPNVQADIDLIRTVLA